MSGSTKMTCPSNVRSVEKHSLKLAIETGMKANVCVSDAKSVSTGTPMPPIAQSNNTMKQKQMRQTNWRVMIKLRTATCSDNTIDEQAHFESVYLLTNNMHILPLFNSSFYK